MSDTALDDDITTPSQLVTLDRESYGVDLCKDTGGETGFDTDLTETIKQIRHQGAVAGRVAGFLPGQELNMRVRIYMPDAGAEQAKTINIEIINTFMM